MSKQMDAVGSFAAIVSNVPAWRERVAEMATHTAQRHTEFKVEYTKLAQKSKPRRMKNRSVCSIHSNDDPGVKTSSAHASSHPQTPLDPVDISPLEAGNQYIYAHATKKRRMGTSIRSAASGPLKFRSRQMVVIYYDGYVQEQLEKLVKEFGGCRSTLRKGRMAYTINKGFQLPSLRRGLDYGSAPINPSGLISRSSPKLSTTKDQQLPTAALPTGEAAFLQADKDLESCQNACETAAHQFLRDGDCRSELDTVLQKLDSVLTLATITHDALKSEQDELQRTERANRTSESIHTTSGSTLVEKPSTEPLNPRHMAASDIAAFPKDRPTLTSTVSAPPPMVADIEVDDDSDPDDIEIDIRQFALSRTNRMRT